MIQNTIRSRHCPELCGVLRHSNHTQAFGMRSTTCFRTTASEKIGSNSWRRYRSLKIRFLLLPVAVRSAAFFSSVVESMSCFSNNDAEAITMFNEFEVYGEVNHEMRDRFESFVRRSTTPTLRIRIDSHGGSADAAEAMLEAIENSDQQFIAYARGLCASASHLVALGCSRIEASSRVRFCLHNSYFPSNIGGDQYQLDAARSRLGQIDSKFVNLLSQRIGLHPTTIKTWMSNGREFDSDEAMQLKIVDRVHEDISTRFPVGSRFWAWNSYTRRTIGYPFDCYEHAANSAQLKRCSVVRSPPRFTGDFELVSYWDDERQSLILRS